MVLTKKPLLLQKLLSCYFDVYVCVKQNHETLSRTYLLCYYTGTHGFLWLSGIYFLKKKNWLTCYHPRTKVCLYMGLSVNTGRGGAPVHGPWFYWGSTLVLLNKDFQLSFPHKALLALRPPPSCEEGKTAILLPCGM